MSKNANSLLHEDIKSNACVSDTKPSIKPINPTAESICQRDEMLSNESITLQKPITSRTSLNKSKCISFIPTAKELDYLKGVPLSDKDFSRPSECDIISGSDCFFTILRNWKIIGAEGQPIAQSTMFGCVVAGQIQKDSNSSTYTQLHLIRVKNDSNIDSILQQFWQMEELPSLKSLLSEEEEFCETYFKSTYKINDRVDLLLSYLFTETLIS
ncbi:DUF1758 domain-containing protein [Nephila pilipes]|uniref:DUF1758 domain-containing protein n=1 Tax=Nephila pilipes TaxID=299642 RepID=A0A8X6MYL4_NEPPI|nr:DUF1758 domain-containing protein [Nephila pilipes]